MALISGILLIGSIEVKEQGWASEGTGRAMLFVSIVVFIGGFILGLVIESVQTRRYELECRISELEARLGTPEERI